MSIQDFKSREINSAFPLIILSLGFLLNKVTLFLTINVLLFLVISLLLYRKKTMASGDIMVLFSLSTVIPIVSLISFGETYLVFFGSLVILGVVNAFVFYKMQVDETPFIHVIGLSYLLTILFV
jgi:hypothetical protein